MTSSFANKRIAILGTAYPYRGGLAAFNERLAYELQENFKCSVQIFTFTVQYPSFLFPGKTQYSDSKATFALNIVRMINSVNPFNWIYSAYKILKFKPDLVIVKFWIPFIGPSLGTILHIVKWFSKAKNICIVDNIIPHEKRVGDRLFTNYFTASIHHFVTMSSSVHQDMAGFMYQHQTKKLLFHPIYDNFGASISKQEALQRLKLSDQHHYILFFGVIRDYKGLDILLEAVSDKITQKNIKTIVAGEFYNDKDTYLQLIKRYGLEQQVYLFDRFIADEDVKNFFCAVDVVVQPYKHATQSGVTQICYHFNKPMIVTRVGGLPEMIEHGVVGYVVEPNALEIRNAILMFYEQHQEQEMTRQVQLAKEKYSWASFSEEILFYL